METQQDLKAACPKGLEGTWGHQARSLTHSQQDPARASPVSTDMEMGVGMPGGELWEPGSEAERNPRRKKEET